MKRFLSVLFAWTLLLSMAFAVHADVIWIPRNSFLEGHMEHCKRSDRAFRALTEVTVYESPESDKVLWQIPEGESVWVYYTYEDSNKNLWGCTENPESGAAGWFPLAYVELVYDYISFAEDFGQTFMELDEPGQISGEYGDSVVMFWAYPGSTSCTEFDMSSWSSDNFPEYFTVYEDTLGRQWAYVNYYFGIRNFWICLDDPTADYDTLYPMGTTPEVAVTQPDSTEATLPAVEIKPAPAGIPIGLTVAIIGCVCATTVVLIRLKKKSQ